MTLESVSERLSELAEAESGLRRSRAMAQLWHEVRQTPAEERRVLARALAERFAPALVERFESVAGVDGPEFIKLVRDLIDVDGDDIRSVITDLSEVSADLATPTRATARAGIDGPASVDRARGESLEDIFEVMSSGDSDQGVAVGDATVEAVDSAAFERAIHAIDQLPDSSAAPSAFDLAQERLQELEEHSDVGEPDIEHSQQIERAPVSRAPAQRVSAEATVPVESAEGDLSGRLERVPDGWKRRRMLSGAIRRGEVDVPTALELAEMLSSRADRGWIAGDLIERGLTPAERVLLRARDLPQHIDRRLDRIG